MFFAKMGFRVATFAADDSVDNVAEVAVVDAERAVAQDLLLVPTAALAGTLETQDVSFQVEGGFANGDN